MAQASRLCEAQRQSRRLPHRFLEVAYKLFLLVDTNGWPVRWEVQPMNVSEPSVAHRLLAAIDRSDMDRVVQHQKSQRSLMPWYISGNFESTQAGIGTCTT